MKITLNKTCKNPMFLFALDLIFCIGNILLGFCWGNRGDANFGLAYKNTSSLQCYIESLTLSSSGWPPWDLISEKLVN